MGSREVDFEVSSGSTNMKLCFGGSEPKLIAYSDSDLAGDLMEGSLLQVILLPIKGEQWHDKAGCKSVWQ